MSAREFVADMLVLRLSGRSGRSLGSRRDDWVDLIHTHFIQAALGRGRVARVMIAGAVLLGGGCASGSHAADSPAAYRDSAKLLNRVTWGVNDAAMRDAARLGLPAYLEQQLHPATDTRLPAEAQAQIDAMTISRRPMPELVAELGSRRKDAETITDPLQKMEAKRAYQQELKRLGTEAATQQLLRALYSPNQLQEQMTWFWLNHFSVYMRKRDLAAMVGDYETHAIRPNSLGRFRALLHAAVFHPAMLRYLDNDRNAAGRINENFARELMELHTLGVVGGYSQRDVQELARVLTGLGVDVTEREPRRVKLLQAGYPHVGLTEFNPKRHDFGDKTLLGGPLTARGAAEIDEALDRLSRHPATARHISRKLAIYFVSDDPPEALVQRMAQTFQRSDGDIAAVLRTLFASDEFARSLGQRFKDPMHYVVSSIRLAYGDKVILNAMPALGWLNRMGELPFGRPTPDGYPMTQEAWSSSGQMSTRFEIARAIGGGSAGLFRSEGEEPKARAALPQLSSALYFQSLEKGLRTSTGQALDQANSPQEWNTFFLAAPESMYR